MGLSCQLSRSGCTGSKVGKKNGDRIFLRLNEGGFTNILPGLGAGRGEELLPASIA